MSDSQIGESHHPRPQWRSRTGFILAAIGSAVGLGNIWRFSYLCYKNGGATFLIPYFIALLVVGIPLMIAELGIGHKMRGSAPLSFARISTKWEWAGWWPVTFVMFGIMLYYSTVIAWCLNYVFYSFNLSWGSDPNNFFFKEFLQLSDGPFQIGDIRTPILFSLTAVWFLSWLIVYFGVQKGVERANKIFMPLLLLLVGILVFWSISLEGAGRGIAVYLKPDLTKLWEFQIWVDAFTQIFFTLSLAFGIMIAYASYLPRKADLVKDAFIISFGNCGFSFFAGFAVFGTLGYMAGVQGVAVEDVVNKSIGLAFVTYPQAIGLMPAFSQLFGFLFFFSLVIAGLSSAISIIEAFSAAMIDKFHYGRNTVVTIVCIAGFLGSIVFTAKSGLYWVDIVDHFITHYGLVIVALIECVLIGWIFKADKLRDHISHSGETPLNAFWDICIKYITPLVLLGLIGWDLYLELFTHTPEAGYEGYSWIAIILLGRDWLIFTLIVALFIAMRPWRKQIENIEA